MNLGAIFSGGSASVLGATFVACAVEMLEVDTIVVGVGAARGWRSTIIGTVSGLIILIAIALGLGISIQSLPLHWLRLVVGFLLLSFGLGWLRKAIAAYATGGREGDEGQVDASQEKQARFAVDDWYAFTLAFKGTLLEGLEIVFITITFGASSGSWTAAWVGAAAAILIMAGIAFLVRGKIAEVPNRMLKFVVGVLLTTFGIFWAAEGAFVKWPYDTVALAPLALVVLAVALSYVQLAKWSARHDSTPETHGQQAHG